MTAEVKPKCAKCGSEKKRYPERRYKDGHRWSCNYCARERKRNHRNITRGMTPVSCAGAKESLDRYLATHYPWYVSRLADLLDGRVSLRETA